MQPALNEDRMVITGGFGALGQAVARVAAARGARLVLLDHAPQAPEGLLSELGANAVEISGVDLSDPAQARDAINRANQAMGGIDALLNIAGGFVWQTLPEGDPSAWERMFRLNLATCVNACHAAVPTLRESGRGVIVNIGANAALRAGVGMGAYTASKAGVHRLTESLAEELKGQVRVNAVLPSIIDTPANRADMPDADFAAWVAPAELAEVILFLASPRASGVTGALMPVTGRV